MWSPGGLLLLREKVLETSSKTVVATSFSDQSKTSLRLELKRFYDVFATSLCRLGMNFRFLHSEFKNFANTLFEKVTSSEQVL